MSHEELVRRMEQGRLDELWRRCVELQLEVLDLRRRVSELEKEKSSGDGD